MGMVCGTAPPFSELRCDLGCLWILVLLNLQDTSPRNSGPLSPQKFMKRQTLFPEENAWDQVVSESDICFKKHTGVGFQKED